jgi:hypothetical protein
LISYQKGTWAGGAAPGLRTRFDLFLWRCLRGGRLQFGDKDLDAPIPGPALGYIVAGDWFV